MPLVEIRVFGLGLLQNGNVRVRIFPERKEILIGGFRFDLITLQCVSPAELQVCQSANRIANNESSMIENLLEFRSGLDALMRGQIGQATHIGGVEISRSQKEFRTAFGLSPEFIGNRGLQQFDSV